MLIHICQVWGNGEHRLLIQTCLSRDHAEDFLLEAEAAGDLRLWGEVIVFVGDSRYTPQQFMRSRRVQETIDGLSHGAHRPGYGDEYVRSLEEDVDLSRYSHAPNTLHTDEWPEDHQEPPIGPDWRLRALIRPFGDPDAKAEQREQKAVSRLAQPLSNEARLQKAVESLQRQLAAPPAKPEPEPELAPAPIPTVDDQLHELALEQDRELPIRPVEQRTRRSIDRYVADLPKRAYIDTSA